MVREPAGREVSARGRYGARKSTERNELGQKFCKVGSHWVDIAKFSRHGATADRLQPRCADCVNARRFEIMYGVTQAWIDAKKAEQDYKCPLCLRATTRWAIDHDHACCPGIKTCGNCIRGLICQGCNNGLGMFGDDPEALRRAAAYLTRTINYSRISA